MNQIARKYRRRPQLSVYEGLVSSRKLIALAVAAYFFSGISALTYQVVWQRMLTLLVGVDLTSSTLVVCAYMAGIGMGSVIGGRMADSLSRRRAIIYASVAELVLAGAAIASAPVIYDFLYQSHYYLSLPRPLLFALLFALLLVPTIAMGMTLPLLSKGLASSIRSAGSIIGLIYSLNTLGAGIGAALCAFLIVPSVGLRGALAVGAAINLLVGVLLFFYRNAAPDRAPDRLQNSRITTVTQRSLLSRWIVFYSLTSFIGLALELVWMRVIGVFMKPTAFTFGYLVSIYLVGLGLGNLLGTALAPRLKNTARTLLLLQAAVPFYACLSMAILCGALWSLPSLRPVWEYLGSYEALSLATAGDNWFRFVFIYLVAPLFLMLPATMLMGTSFPFMQRLEQQSFEYLGRKVGLLQAASIAGSVAGLLVVNFFAFEFIGTPGTLLCLLAGGTLISALFVASLPAYRAFTAVACIALAAISVLILPRDQKFWSKFHGSHSSSVIAAEDGTGVAVIRADDAEFRSARVFVNGLGQSWIPFGGVHTMLGIVPAFVHPNPRKVAVIGLGSGDTLFAAAGRPETVQIHGIELVAPLTNVLQDYRGKQSYGGLERLFEDSRFIHVIEDGRSFLARTDQRFDIIEADALRPTSAYAGNLYSVEFFELVRSRLATGGFAVTWNPTARTENSFRRAFPYIIRFSAMLIGSNEPITFNREEVLARAVWSEDYYRDANIDLVHHLESILPTFERVDPMMQGDEESINRDLYPRDEFSR